MRADGYAPIRDYAAIGDGRTVALVARDGSIDWLCLPDLDSPSVLAGVLDAERGGRFALQPDEPYDVERRYLPETNVLETTLSTAGGAVRVTDAMTLPDGRLGPLRELVRKVEGLSGNVALRWRVEPRFGAGGWSTRLDQRSGVPVASAGSDAIAVCAWQAGDPVCSDGAIAGQFEARAGAEALLALAVAHQEPLVFPARAESERRLPQTAAAWRRWASGRRYAGLWREAVVRSALALKLLVYAPSGAVAAAATTSLPEEIGGERNWDYRFSWIRDSAFTLDAFLKLGCGNEAHAFFWWLMHASQLTHPRLQVLYRLDGGAQATERTVPLAGYRGSRPVRIGNGAVEQLQLDIYGHLFQTAWLYAGSGRRIDADIGRRLAETADLVGQIWRDTDAGIWEVRSEPVHFTQSKMMCWVALDGAVRLAEAGHIPDRGVPRWQAEAAAIRSFVETECWSERKRSYVRVRCIRRVDITRLKSFIIGLSAGQNQVLPSTTPRTRSARTQSTAMLIGPPQSCPMVMNPSVARRDHRNLGGNVRPARLRRQHRDHAARAPRRRLLLGTHPWRTMGHADADRPALLPRRRDPEGTNRLQRNNRLGVRRPHSRRRGLRISRRREGDRAWLAAQALTDSQRLVRAASEEPTARRCQQPVRSGKSSATAARSTNSPAKAAKRSMSAALAASPSEARTAPPEGRPIAWM
jgi:GH15 family glucan-1,4-alpha-glucosidase